MQLVIPLPLWVTTTQSTFSFLSYAACRISFLLGTSLGKKKEERVSGASTYGGSTGRGKRERGERSVIVRDPGSHFWPPPPPFASNIWRPT